MFRKKTQQWTPPDRAVTYPKWTFAKVNGGDYWLVLEKTKMRFISERAFMSWGRRPVIASKESLSGYNTWKPIGFAPGTLVRSMSGQTYYITGSDILAPERRLINTPDFYTVLGFDYNNVIIVSMDELQHHKEGAAINGI